MPYSLSTTHATGQLIQAADINAIAAAIDTTTAGVYNVKEAAYGAKGDGTTDDTAAIQAALTACTTAGGGTVYLPPGTYIVKPTTTTRLVVGNNTWVKGAGMDATTLKVSGSAGNYGTVFGATNDSTRGSHIAFSDFRVDQNPSGNTTCDVQNANDTTVQNAIRFYSFDHITVERVRFDPATGVNTVELAGNNTASTHAAVRDCQIVFALAHTTQTGSYYDNSAIYIEAANHQVIGCRGEAPVASTGAFIESHGGPSTIVGNVTDLYRTGVNVVPFTNAADVRLSNDIGITGNTFDRAVWAITLWPVAGFTLRGVRIAGNSFGLAQVTQAASQCWAVGVDQTSGMTGTMESIAIVGNTVVCEADTRVAASIDGNNSGAFFLPGRGPITNLLIADNAIQLAPGTGLRVGLSGYLGANLVTGAEISGNVLLNCGYNSNSAYRNGLFLDGTLTDVSCHDNTVVDNASTSPGSIYALRADFTMETCTRVGVWDNHLGPTLTSSVDKTKVAQGTAVQTVAAQPTAAALYRGVLVQVQGGTGVADHLYYCAKNASNAYVWTTLV